MALQVWLPLDGNLENKGLSDISVTNNGATVNASGKIGSCFEFDGSDDITTSSINTSSWTNFSICCWAKADSSISDGTWHRICGVGEHKFFQLDMSSTDIPRFFVSSAGSTTGFGASGTTSIVDGLWHHICGTANDTEIALYIDGSLVRTTARTAIYYPDSAVARVGSVNNGNKFVGQINDVRIYDHCLSGKEVKELSKGLIGHWPLNDMVGGENLLSVTPRTHTATAYNAYQFNLSENLVAGQTYTIQLWNVDVSHASKSAADLGVDVYWGGGSVRLYWWHGTSYFTDGHADHLQATFTVTEANASGSGATNAWLNIYNSVGYVAADMSMTIGKWKLEKGSIATPWTPNPSDDLYSAMGLDEGIVYDTSGYGRNGSVSGTITADSDTPRYSVRPLYSSTTASFQGGSIDLHNQFGHGSTYTLACWAKPTGLNSSGWVIRLGGNNCGLWWAKSEARWVWNENDNGKRCANPTISGDYDNWHHIVNVVDKTTPTATVVKHYVDGVPAADYPSHTFDTSSLTQPGSGFYMYFYNAHLSDVRLYSTALSADDIKELYETSASVDNNGNFWGYELVDNGGV